MFKILSRYIFLSVAGSAAIAMLFIGFVFGAANLLRDVLGYMLDGRLPFGMFLQLSWLMAQFVATYAVPIGLLIGVLLVLGRLSADNEITAMRTAGRSILQIGRPILVLAVIGVVVELGVNFYFMPKARVDYHVKLEESLRETALNFFVPKTFIRDIPGWVVFFDSREGSVYHNLWVWHLDKQQRTTEVYHAVSATLEFDTETGEGSILPTIYNAEIRNTDDPENPSKIFQPNAEGDGKRVLPLSDILGKRGMNQKVQWLTLPQLLAEKQRLADAHADPIAQLKVSYTIQEKLTFALAVFSFALVAIPLGIRTQRKESSANIGLALLLVVAYYIMATAISWLDKRPDLHPEILIWLPNIVFIIAGVWLLRRVERT